jgi:hypothetical protein
MCRALGRQERRGRLEGGLGETDKTDTRILLLPCRGNILLFRSEAGRTDEWARAHFFVGPVGV